MKENEMKQNKMGVMPVPRLLLNMGLPMMISMLGQALYNVVDTFTGRPIHELGKNLSFTGG